jgi:5-methylcytosine-specific restriction endonuclease McrA
VRRTGALRRRMPLRRSGFLRRSRLRPGAPRRRRGISEASAGQREKVAGARCLVCGRVPCDPAHLVPRSLGGCDEADCVVPLCRPCHRDFDGRRLDLLPYLEPRYRTELAHALLHVGLVGLVRRLRADRDGVAKGSRS